MGVRLDTLWISWICTNTKLNLGYIDPVNDGLAMSLKGAMMRSRWQVVNNHYLNFESATGGECDPHRFLPQSGLFLV